jgi:AcrR family transcriptional regulator
MAKRKYRGTVQAEVAALTRQRIIEATLALFAGHWIEEVTLEQVATQAGVTVQTVLRHFGSKEGLGAAAGRAANDAALVQRNEVVIGDFQSITQNLVEHYEQLGDRVIRLLAQEDRYTPLKELLQEGRMEYQRWVRRAFAPYLDRYQTDQQESLIAQLVVICDVYVWKLLRRDMGFSVEQYRATLLEMITALVGHSDAPHTD